MNKRSYLSALLASAAVGTRAQDICSCSPTVFKFILDFSNIDCAIDTVADNPGIEMTLCKQEEVDAVPGQDNRLLRDYGEHDEKKRRSLQTVEKIVEVVSAQFLEFKGDGDLTVIYTNNTYATTSLVDGDAMQFYSVSSKLDTSIPLEDQMEDPDLVPGGASLILYGTTESGKVYRNRFFWSYDLNNCGTDNNPVQVGDQIGWVKIEPDLGGAWPAFCPALPGGSPTISPQTDDPSLTPSAPPIEKTPTATPVAVTTDSPIDPPTDPPSDYSPPSSSSDSPPSSSLIPGPSPTRQPIHRVFGKSAKAKTLKPPKSYSKSSKSSKSAKSSSWKSRHGYLNAHIVYEDLKMNSSSMASSFGISLITTLALALYFSGEV